MNPLQITPCLKSDYLYFEDTLHDSPFQCDIEVLPEQTSIEVDHINNIEYLRWIDKASELHCDACGWDRARLLKAGVMWFVARHEIDYRSEARQEEQLRLTTWVEDVRRVKSWRTTTIHAISETPRLVCSCRTLWVLVDLQTKKSKSVPVEMATSLSPLIPPKGLTT